MAHRVHIVEANGERAAASATASNGSDASEGREPRTEALTPRAVRGGPTRGRCVFAPPPATVLLRPLRKECLNCRMPAEAFWRRSAALTV